MQDFMVEVLEGIEVEKKCEHTPDKVIPMDVDYEGDRIIQRSQCECGKLVDEIFTLSHTKVS